MIFDPPTARDELARLVRQLAEAHDAVRAYGGEQLDSVIAPDGNLLLLREAQEALRSSEERFHAIVDASVDCIITSRRLGVDQDMRG